jgi:CheY-like chemotaxis protein/HPt (histidine-containing phosphotransfer) domain-containing protein
VSTSALTARSVLRAIALASGRVVDPLADSEAFDSPRQVRADAPVVLVAEDHPTNRIVIRRQLGLLGVRCMIAGDGQEALEMLDRQDFALLLADCHMPRLDGYELTQRIREAEQRTGEHLPIVALTASALPSEAERCIASGMDLVLTKPVALDALERALSPWLSFEDSTPNGASEGAPPKEESVVDLSILRELLGDDDEAIDEVTSTFLESAAESVAQFDEAYAAGNTPGVRSAAHRLLGAARTLGATQLVQVCEEVEASNEAVPLEVADRLHHELSSVTGALAGLRSVRG